MNSWSADLAILLPLGFDSNSPSMRLRRLNLVQPLRKLGVKAHLVYDIKEALKFNNILLCHLGQDVIDLVKIARKEGKSLYFCHSEALFNLGYQSIIFNNCDYIICCSTKLAELTQNWLNSKFTKCVVIPDMAEGPYPHPIHQPKKKENLTVGITSMGGNVYLSRQLQPIIDSLGMKLLVISEHDDADIKWNRDTYLSDMVEHFDISICPQNVNLQPAKSNVKLTLSMSLGIPTICSNSQAYLEIVKNGENAFIASNIEDWRESLIKLKNYDLRCKISKNALETAEAYHPLVIAQKYKNLLNTKKKIAFVNNKLPQKYLSYGESLLENLRFNGFADYEEFYYEDLEIISNFDVSDYDMFIFIEIRYNSEDIISFRNWNIPKILITKEDQDINNFAFFNLIITPNRNLAEKWFNRGFINTYYVEDLSQLNYQLLVEYLGQYQAKRKEHNFKIHDLHINQFNSLLLPEQRWKNGIRDESHIAFTIENTEKNSKILDIGSADGFLALKLAVEGRQVSALEFVQRGIDWTNQHKKRLGVDVDLRRGFIEDIDDIFKNSKFDCICLFEILEHLDYWKLPWYLEKVESLLTPTSKVLITLPCQNLVNNSEHLYTPSKKLIDKLFSSKKNYQIKWVDMPGHEIPGNWFISYSNSKIKEIPGATLLPSGSYMVNKVYSIHGN